MELTTYTIDAAGKKLGRVATEAASALRGKNRADFTPNRLPDVRVRITNAEALAISDKKAGEKTYQRYSGYPGGRTVETLAQLRSRHGSAELIRRAVSGMLPSNRLRAHAMKRLEVFAGEKAE